MEERIEYQIRYHTIVKYHGIGREKRKKKGKFQDRIKGRLRNENSTSSCFPISERVIKYEMMRLSLSVGEKKMFLLLEMYKLHYNQSRISSNTVS